jgi:DNA-binding SARP family transcriptional activator/WD40 repeat protein
MIQFGVLGSLEIRLDGTGVELTSPRMRRVLAVLLVHANEVVSSDRLLEWGWPDGWPSGAEATLRTTVSRLRTVLEPDRPRAESTRLRTQPPGYLLRVDAGELDAARFEAQVADAGRRITAGDAVEACRMLDLALGLWRGAAYAEFADEDWARPVAARLDEVRLAALESRAAAMLACGLHADVVGQLEELIRQHPERDGLRAHHMLALYRSGRQAHALRAFQEHRLLLAEGSGLEPSAELKRLEGRIATSDPTLDLPVALGRPLRSYRLLDRIGEGPCGVVYRATQPSSGRDVAVKALRADVSNDPDLIRAFAFDTQAVMALTHPHLAELQDAWRDPDGAFLVSRLFPRGNAAKVFGDRPVRADVVAHLVARIGAALRHAHEHGIVHGRVTTTNVLIDEHGDAHLGDLVSGRPAARGRVRVDLAPELLEGEPATRATDQHGLATVAWSLLAGPGADVDVDGLAPPIREVLGTGTSRHPRDRYEHLDAFLDAFAVATTRTGRARPALALEPDRNPYKGLRPFQELDAEDFHGRKQLVGELVARLDRPGVAGRFLALVGPSGSGKSSAVRGGLVPALRGGAVPGSARWFVATMIPSTDPFAELETALMRVAVHPPRGLAEQLSRDGHALGRTVARLLPDDTTELLLVIDQLEELFTLTSDEAVRSRFLDGLVTTVADPHARVRVVVTLRADFYDRPLRYQPFAELFRTHQVTITPLTSEELHEAIAAPAARRDVIVDAAVVGRMISALADHSAALPLLQHAMAQLFDRREGQAITMAGYEALGGATGALALVGENTYESLGAAAQSLSQQVFGRLVTLGEGVADTRRRVRRTELALASSDVITLDQVLRAFGDARLVTFDHEPGTREPTVELAHEALITGWPRLQRWIDDDRDALRTQRQLTAAATSWADGERDPDDLYRGARLDSVAEWVDKSPVELTALEREFIGASVDERDREHELDRQRVRHQAQQNRRLRSLLAGLAVAMAVSLVAGFVAVHQRDDANHQADRAEAATADAVAQAAAAEAARADASAQAVAAERARDEADQQATEAVQARADAETRRLVSASAAELEEHRTIALLLAAEAYERAKTPATLGALQTALTGTSDFLGNMVRGRNHWNMAFTPDGDEIVEVGDEGVGVWDVATQRLVRAIDIDVVDDPHMALSADGNSAAVTTPTGVTVVDLRSGVVSKTVSTNSTPTSAAFHPTLPLLAIGTDQGRVLVWDLARGQAAWDLQGFDAGTVRTLAFPGDGTRLVGVDVVPTAPSSQVAVWDRDTGQQLSSIQIGDLLNAVVDRDGRQLLATATGVVTVYDLATGAVVVERHWPNSNDLLFGVVALSEGRLATGGSSGEVLVWDRDGEVERILPVRDGSVQALAASPDGSTLAVAASEGVSLWALDGRQLIAREVPGDSARSVSLDDDGTRLVTTGTVPFRGLSVPHLWDITGSRPVELAWPPTPEPVLRAFATAHVLVTMEGSAELGPFTTRVWDASTLAPLGPPMVGIGGTIGWNFTAASPDGGTVAFAGALDRTFDVRDVRTGRQVALLSELAQPELVNGCPLLLSLSFDPAGQRLLGSECGGAAEMWETSTWTGRSLDPERSMFNARFSTDGAYVFSSDRAGLLSIRDADTLAVVGTALGHRDIAFMDGDPRTGLVISGGTADRTARLWAFQDGNPVQIGRPFPSAIFPVTGPGLFVTRSLDDQVWLWDIDASGWLATACRAAGRNLTAAEWQQYGPQDQPFHATCPADA